MRSFWTSNFWSLLLNQRKCSESRALVESGALVPGIKSKLLFRKSPGDFSAREILKQSRTLRICNIRVLKYIIGNKRKHKRVLFPKSNGKSNGFIHYRKQLIKNAAKEQWNSESPACLPFLMRMVEVCENCTCFLAFFYWSKAENQVSIDPLIRLKKYEWSLLSHWLVLDTGDNGQISQGILLELSQEVTETQSQSQFSNDRTKIKYRCLS